MSLEEELRLNIDPALTEVDRLGATLTQVTQRFSVDLASALEPLQSVSVSVPVDANVDDVPSEIEAAAGDVTLQVPVDADTASAEAELESLPDPPAVVVPVEADTSQAEADINALGDSAGGATTALTGLSSAGTGLGVAAGVAGGGASELTGALGDLGPAAAAGVGGLAAITAAATQFFQAASGNVQAAQRLNNTFGEFSDTVQKVDIGGLNTTLDELGQRLGTNASDTQEAAANLGNMAQAAGQSQEASAGFANQVVTLSARAVALNPALGDVSDVSDRLGTALARGGRFAQQYGLSLTTTEINARALADTGKQNVTQLTQVEKSAAGAAIATERYGSTLNEVITKGAESPIVQLKALKNRFAEFTEEIGKPLLTPALDLLTQIQPTLKNVASLLSTLAQALLPIGQAAFTALQPLIDGVLNTANALVSSLLPVIQTAAQAFTSLVQPIAGGLARGLDGLVKGFLPLADAIQKVVAENGPLIELLGTTLGTLAEGAGLTIGAVAEVIGRLVSALSDLGAFTNPLISIAEELGLIDKSSTAAAGSLDKVGSTAKASVTTLADLNKSLEEADAGFAQMITTSSAFSKDSAVVDALRQTRIPFADLKKDLGDLDKGMKDFVARAIEAGQVTITSPEGVKLTGAEVRNLNGTLTDYLNTSGAIVQGNGLVASFAAQANATEAQAQATFSAIAAQQGLTQEQINSIGANAAAQFGVDSYSNRLQVLAQQTNDAAAAQANAGATIQNQAAGWVALTQAVANGTITSANAAAVAQVLGVDVQTAAQAITNAESAVNNFVATTIAKFPGVQQAFDSLKQSANPNDPQSLANALNLSTLASLTFQSTLDTLRQKFPETVAFLQQQGPQAAGAFTQAFASASPEVQAQLEAAIVANKGAIGTIEADLRGSIGGNVATAKDLGEQVTQGLADKLKFDQVTDDQVKAASQKLRDSAPGVAADAGNTGDAVGKALGQGIAFGLGSTNALVEQAARNAVARAEQAARDQAESRSPSQLFARLGQDLIAGLDQGIRLSSPGVVSSIESTFNQFAIAAGDATDNVILSQQEALARYGDRIITSLSDPRIRGKMTVGDIVDTEHVVAGTPAALRAVTVLAGKLRTAALKGLASTATPAAGAPPVLQEWLGMAPNGAPLTETQAAVKFWGEQVGNQIVRSWTSGRLGTLVDQFTNARVQTPPTSVGNQRLGQLPGNATVVVNVDAPAGTDPTAAKELGKTIGNEVRGAVVSLRAQVFSA